MPLEPSSSLPRVQVPQNLNWSSSLGHTRPPIPPQANQNLIHSFILCPSLPASSEITTILRCCGSFCQSGNCQRKLIILVPFSGSIRFLFTDILEDTDLGIKEKRTVYLEEKSCFLTDVWYHQNKMTVGSPFTLVLTRWLWSKRQQSH